MKIRGLGIEFQRENENNILQAVFKNIDVESYYWTAEDCEIYDCNLPNQMRVDITGMAEEGDKLFRELMHTDDFYMDFAVFKAFPNKKAAKEINSYNEFVHSNCKIAFLICDFDYCDIFVKDMELLEKLKSNIENHLNIKYIRYLNGEEKERTILRVKNEYV